MWPALFVMLALLGWLALGRANELCALGLSVDGARLLRGRAPAALLSDAAEVARRARVPETTVRVVIEGGEPRLVAPAGLADAVVQQLRNVVGQYRVVHFRGGRRAD